MTRGAQARLFVAVDLPAEVRVQLALWARGCAASVRAAAPPAVDPLARRSPAERGRSRSAPTHGRLRLLEAGTLHLTLCFLGDRPVEEIEAIGDALAEVCAEAEPVGELALGVPLWLPPRRPRALAVELHDDPDRTLQALHDAVAAALEELCGRASEAVRGGSGRGGARGGRFRPHVTVARMRAGDAPRARDLDLPVTPQLSFRPGSVTLLRSWLTPIEASYEQLATHVLTSHRRLI
jgi:RNA 2',3'-cyclic 3'-phosphodiesterase